MTVSINLSPVEFRNAELADEIIALVREMNVVPGKIDFENLKNSRNDELFNKYKNNTYQINYYTYQTILVCIYTEFYYFFNLITITPLAPRAP